MANVNFSVSGAALVITSAATSSQIVNSNSGSPTLASTVSVYEVLHLTGSTLLTLPNATVFAVWIRNLTAGQTVECKLTPAGGAAPANGLILLSNGLFTYINTAETSGGVSAITLIPSAAMDVEVGLAQ